MRKGLVQIKKIKLQTVPKSPDGRTLPKIKRSSQQRATTFLRLFPFMPFPHSQCGVIRPREFAARVTRTHISRKKIRKNFLLFYFFFRETATREVKIPSAAASVNQAITPKQKSQSSLAFPFLSPDD